MPVWRRSAQTGGATAPEQPNTSFQKNITVLEILFLAKLESELGFQKKWANRSRSMDLVRKKTLYTKQNTTGFTYNFKRNDVLPLDSNRRNYCVKTENFKKFQIQFGLSSSSRESATISYFGSQIWARCWCCCWLRNHYCRCEIVRKIESKKNDDSGDEHIWIRICSCC